MRKWRFTRPAVSPFETAVLALVIALAAHAVLLLPDYRTPGEDRAASTSGVQMLNLSALTREKQSEFRNWISIHDPAQVARSDSRSGYTAVLKKEKQVNVHIKPYRMAEVGDPVEVTAFSTVPTGGSPAKSVPEPVVKTAPERTARVAVIFDGTGKKIAEIPGNIPDTLGSDVPTVVTLTEFGRVAGVTLTRSCGSRELDLMALNAAAKMNVKRNAVLTVLWPGKVKK